MKKLIEINKYYFSRLKFKFFNRKFRKTKPSNIYLDSDSKKIQEIYDLRKNNKTLFLQTQVGRGGAKWIMDIINSIGKVRAYGERNPYEESYFRYCSSHRIKDFNEEFLNLLKSEIISDWERENISYVSSPYFSHGIEYLTKKLNPQKLIILVPSADHLMNSFYNKGWYKENISIELNQFSKKKEKLDNHFYGRLINLGISKENFNELSQIGRITLFMSKCIEVIYNQLDRIDKTDILIFRLDDADQNYKYCKNFIQKLGLNLTLNEQEFLEYKKRTASNHENRKLLLSNEEKKEIKQFVDQYQFIENKILDKFDSKHF